MAYLILASMEKFCTFQGPIEEKGEGGAEKMPVKQWQPLALDCKTEITQEEG